DQLSLDEPPAHHTRPMRITGDLDASSDGTSLYVPILVIDDVTPLPDARTTTISGGAAYQPDEDDGPMIPAVARVPVDETGKANPGGLSQVIRIHGLFGSTSYASSVKLVRGSTHIAAAIEGASKVLLLDLLHQHEDLFALGSVRGFSSGFVHQVGTG